MAIAHVNKEQQCTTMRSQGVVAKPKTMKKKGPIKNSKKRTNQTIVKQMKTLY
jgi:hypothetical protein